VPDKPGAGARFLAALQGAGTNLIGVSAFPHGARRSQLDLVREDSVAFARAARTAGVKLSAKKSGFLIQGEDRAGAVADIMKRLSTAKINVTSVQVFYLAQAATAACSGSRHRTWAKPPKCLRSRNTPREAIPGVKPLPECLVRERCYPRLWLILYPFLRRTKAGRSRELATRISGCVSGYWLCVRRSYMNPPAPPARAPMPAPLPPPAIAPMAAPTPALPPTIATDFPTDLR
jgi:hypothetical protein